MANQIGATDSGVATQIQQAKERAAVAYAKGNPQGLTSLAFGFYEVLARKKLKQ